MPKQPKKLVLGLLGKLIMTVSHVQKFSSSFPAAPSVSDSKFSCFPEFSSIDEGKSCFLTHPRFPAGTHLIHRVAGFPSLLICHKMSVDTKSQETVLVTTHLKCLENSESFFLVLQEGGLGDVPTALFWPNLSSVLEWCGNNPVPQDVWKKIIERQKELLMPEWHEEFVEQPLPLYLLDGVPVGVFFIAARTSQPDRGVIAYKILSQKTCRSMITVSPRGTFLLWKKGTVVGEMDDCRKLFDYLELKLPLQKWFRSEGGSMLPYMVDHIVDPESNFPKPIPQRGVGVPKELLQKLSSKRVNHEEESKSEKDLIEKSTYTQTT